MKQSNKVILLLLGVILLCAVIGLACIGTKIAPTAEHALQISQLLQPMMEAKNQTMHISLSARVNGEPITLDTDVYLVTEDAARFTALEQTGMTLYITDSLLLLENGKAFRLGEGLSLPSPSDTGLLTQVAALYEALTISAQETEDSVTYGITVTGDQARQLLEAFSLGASLPVEGIRTLDLRLTEKNGSLSQLHFTGDGEFEGTSLELEVTVTGFRILASGDYPIPETVKQTVATVDPNGLFSLTEDLYRLVLALAPFRDMDSIDGTLALTVDCGLLQLDVQQRLSQLNAASSGQLDPEQLQALPELLGWLCMEGDISCSHSGSTDIYSLTLDDRAMAQLAQMLLPELRQYSDSLTQGTARILLESGEITAMEISIEGRIHALIAQIPILVEAVFSFD